ncbi:MAG: TIGR02186 family protein [Oceanicaulis sp.]
MIARLAALLAFILAAPAAAQEAAQEAAPDAAPPQARISAALTQDVVEIRSNFAGAELTLFGAAVGLREGDDIVMVVRGPQRDLRVMRKERVAGIWVNAAPVRFEAVPSFYAVASTRPLDEFATFSALRRNSLGMEHLRLSAPETERTETRFGITDVRVSDLGGDIVDYRAAVVRNKARQDLYAEAAGGVEIIENGLFAARLYLPPVTPTGVYDAEVYLFRGGEPIARWSDTLEVAKAGAERAIYDLAHDHPLVYGVLAVIMAALAGWIAAVFGRRQ